MNYTFSTQNYQCAPQPLIPQQISYLINPAKGIKHFYQIISNSEKKIYKNKKWDQDFGYEIPEELWKHAYNICFKTIKDHYLIWHQYKILNRILGTHSLMYKVKIKTTNRCNICQNHEETLFHLFINCLSVATLWEDLNN